VPHAAGRDDDAPDDDGRHRLLDASAEGARAEPLVALRMAARDPTMKERARWRRCKSHRMHRGGSRRPMLLAFLDGL
jgi:hypothetical protein